jgi:hypothetical protein
MISLVPFEPGHLDLLDVQEAQRGTFPANDPAYGLSLLQAGPCWSVVECGSVLACGGLCVPWEGRAVAWAILSQGVPVLALTRAVQHVLALPSIPRRVECFVDVSFQQGIRWAEMLGFQREGLMRAFSPDGRDHILFARVT